MKKSYIKSLVGSLKKSLVRFRDQGPQETQLGPFPHKKHLAFTPSIKSGILYVNIILCIYNHQRNHR